MVGVPIPSLHRLPTITHKNIVVCMGQITDPSRKMLDHTIPAWAESEAAYLITICCRERGKNTLAFPDIAKIIFDAAQAYEQRRIYSPQPGASRNSVRA